MTLPYGLQSVSVIPYQDLTDRSLQARTPWSAVFWHHAYSCLGHLSTIPFSVHSSESIRGTKIISSVISSTKPLLTGSLQTTVILPCSHTHPYYTTLQACVSEVSTEQRARNYFLLFLYTLGRYLLNDSLNPLSIWSFPGRNQVPNKCLSLSQRCQQLQDSSSLRGLCWVHWQQEPCTT